MADRVHKQTPGGPGGGLGCDEWESLLADAMDGALSVTDQEAFDRHMAECALCSQMWKETERGRAWMQYLAEEPEVPAGLLNKILARTSEGAASSTAAPVLSLPARPAWQRVVLPAARQMVEPRLLMTAAMAFFSIALTLNLTGIRLSELRAQDFQPSRLKATLTRQFYSTNAQVTKYYENLRLVYEMESRVRELRRTTESTPAPAPQSGPKAPTSDVRPSSRAPRRQHLNPAPEQETGSRERVLPPAEVVPAGWAPDHKPRWKKEGFRAVPSTTEDPGQRSWA
jgi:hypothetical protein